MKLSDLKNGQKAIVVKVLGYGGFRKRIVEMGFIKGKVVECLQSAPLKDPVKYGIMGYEVSLRRSEASQIEVITLQEAESMAKEEFSSEYHGVMTDTDYRNIALNKRKTIHVALVGNPNSGKTSLFNIASGKKENVGNYAGVTVESKEGYFDHNGYRIKIVDLPGTYSLSAYSPEERYVREHVIEKMPDIIINVVDASSLERNLFLTTQLIDMNLRTVIALNMYDELLAKGDKLDHVLLSKLLGVPIVPTVSPQKTGIKELFDAVIALYEGADILDENGFLIKPADEDAVLDKHHHQIKLLHRHHQGEKCTDACNEEFITKVGRHVHINYGHSLENAIEKVKSHILKNENARDVYSPRYQSVKLLEGDAEMENFAKQYPNYEQIAKQRDDAVAKIQSELGSNVETAVMDAQYGFIAGALKEAYIPAHKPEKQTLTAKIDNVVLHKWWGIPLFVLILASMFVGTFVIGSWVKDSFFEKFVGFVSITTSYWLPDGGWFKDLWKDGIMAGIGGVFVFFPHIFILFFFITFLEATGYMARAAFIMDRIMHKIGLHGRSFIPLMMGFGCNVPAIMATRIIENHNSRIVTILVNPLITCTARIPIYTLIAGAFFASFSILSFKGGLIVCGVYVASVFLAGLMAKIFKKFLFPHEEIPFVMELSPYRKPSFKYIRSNTWVKASHFLRKMGTVIAIGSITIWALNYFPRHDEKIAGNELTTEMKMEQQRNSHLGKVGEKVAFVMRPLGFDEKLSIAVLAGVAAKEVVASTVLVLFNIDNDEEKKEKEIRALWKARQDADSLHLPVPSLWETVKKTGFIALDLQDEVDKIGDLREKRRTAKEAGEKPTPTFIGTVWKAMYIFLFEKDDDDNSAILHKKMLSEGIKTPVALSFMFFILIYLPCFASILAIKKETGGWKWMCFAIVYTLALAWTVSFIVYQVGTFVSQSGNGKMVITGVLIAGAVWLASYKLYKVCKKKTI